MRFKFFKMRHAVSDNKNNYYFVNRKKLTTINQVVINLF